MYRIYNCTIQLRNKEKIEIPKNQLPLALYN